MDINKKHNTEIYKDEQHGHHQKNIAQKYIKMTNMDDTKNIAQKYIKMSNMDITKNITQKYIKKSNKDITKKHDTEIYKDEQHEQHHKKKHRNI